MGSTLGTAEVRCLTSPNGGLEHAKLLLLLTSCSSWFGPPPRPNEVNRFPMMVRAVRLLTRIQLTKTGYDDYGAYETTKNEYDVFAIAKLYLG